MKEHIDQGVVGSCVGSPLSGAEDGSCVLMTSVQRRQKHMSNPRTAGNCFDRSMSPVVEILVAMFINP